MTFDWGAAKQARGALDVAAQDDVLGVAREDVPDRLAAEAAFLDAVERVLLSAGLEYFGTTIHVVHESAVARLARLRREQRVFFVDAVCSESGRCLLRVAARSASGVDANSRIRFPETGAPPLVVGLSRDRYASADGGFAFDRLASALDAHVLEQLHLAADAVRLPPLRAEGGVGAAEHRLASPSVLAGVAVAAGAALLVLWAVGRARARQ